MSSFGANRLSRARRSLTVAAALTCALAAAAPATAKQPAPAPAPTLGPPDYSGYCQSLGYVRSAITPDKHWGCLHGDNTVSPLNLQAACEVTFTQRPISAQQLTPGVPFTWQCLQSSAPPSEGATTGGVAPGAGGSSTALAAALSRALTPTGRAAKIGALLKRGGYSLRFTAPLAGRLSISWYFLPRGARLAKATPKPVLVATGSVSYARPAGATIRIALTAAGRRSLKHARRLKLTARGTFAPPGAAAARALRTFTLSR